MVGLKIPMSSHLTIFSNISPLQFSLSGVGIMLSNFGFDIPLMKTYADIISYNLIEQFTYSLKSKV